MQQEICWNLSNDSQKLINLKWYWSNDFFYYFISPYSTFHLKCSCSYGILFYFPRDIYNIIFCPKFPFVKEQKSLRLRSVRSPVLSGIFEKLPFTKPLTLAFNSLLWRSSLYWANHLWLEKRKMSSEPPNIALATSAFTIAEYFLRSKLQNGAEPT